ncbi:MAG: GntR family transcriptional regulator [Desulfomicrobium sp.]|uniref:GntR family transcriptional regulator n=1 Tax=Hoeflea sp. TaxID=1940281 RepID=UPI0025C72D4D|nr:GntR family transcriptional regulator [Hoeflea sp.]MBU4530888.1 GntR family transcriptional regulator [Alphaproteobacteria bacterium]MBV1713144.1 GntR family transcriptional regulator [Desulfomicrobium sp.]MBU4542339.1 GntR family transcriptional regulator [Alphaproteobacteria bacterium]MBU4551103.1 GntR family transcriptional regulator [Alphaproteobacteria bacterium]MBV1785061.1 GntR family transcriptional regulator [Hoeflea sp.]
MELLTGELAEGRHESGARIIEARIAKQFGVSRAPVRQALAAMAARGLLSVADGLGYQAHDGSQALAIDMLPVPPASSAQSDGIGNRHAWESIYGEVEDAIASHIPFGAFQVPETALAREFDVSRTVARDVLARLQSRGLVEMGSGRWTAPALTPKRMDELYRLRGLLEPSALKEAQPNLPPDLVDACLERLTLASDHAPDGEVLDRLENDLHHLVLSHCGNDVLLQAVSQSQSLLLAHRYLYKQTSQLFETEPFIAEHMRILEALQSGRTSQAVDLMHVHLMDSRSRALKRIEYLRSTGPQSRLSYLRPVGD